LKNLSVKLTNKYGDGWSLPHLKNIRQFYLTYSKRLNTVYPIDPTKAIQRVANSPESAYSVDPIQFEIPNKFTLYLPDKDLLQAKVREWIAEFKETNGDTE
jgi:hypothetical protein